MPEELVRSRSRSMPLPSIRVPEIGQLMLHRTQVLQDPHEALNSRIVSCLLHIAPS